MSSTPTALPDPVTLREVYQQQQAYTRITPLLIAESLSKLIHGEVLVKAESLQKTGAFKFRGAVYRLLLLTPEQKQQGVTAYSSGNFARGLAAAGQMLNIKVTLVMPADAPQNKINSARKLGANVVLCQQMEPSREEAAQKLSEDIATQNGSILLHPFDDPEIIKGQSAVGVELMQQLQQRQIQCQSLLCPVGGGSLVAGCSLLFGPFHTSTQVFGIEPEGYAGMNQSLLVNHISRAPGKNLSHCDALLSRSPGKANFEVVRQTSVKGIQVSEPFVVEAVQMAFEELKLVLEPSGAIALGALLQYPSHFRGQTVVAIATGGNIDKALFRELLGR
ncbi:threonine ammonia-lyase [Endozoicomonas euniceicola]|uniref:Threonine/serine dehydratase n=1 Tax=Endozoicomonas euniceicola TaxID=1234143 RepID=A0ABY6GT95_9GAMM|nr:threonine/serine dehydratase [Endozoicomonas euniceicola]UYM15782.1 threonine/serine dehydratase [Endozoicomonas euniceicola]